MPENERNPFEVNNQSSNAEALSPEHLEEAYAQMQAEEDDQAAYFEGMEEYERIRRGEQAEEKSDIDSHELRNAIFASIGLTGTPLDLPLGDPNIEKAIFYIGNDTRLHANIDGIHLQGNELISFVDSHKEMIADILPKALWDHQQPIREYRAQQNAKPHVAKKLRTTSEIMSAYRADCKEIAEQCREEGYPSHGSNYDLRTEQLWEEWYAEEYEEAEEREQASEKGKQPESSLNREQGNKNDRRKELDDVIRGIEGQMAVFRKPIMLKIKDQNGEEHTLDFFPQEREIFPNDYEDKMPYMNVFLDGKQITRDELIDFLDQNKEAVLEAFQAETKRLLSEQKQIEAQQRGSEHNERGGTNRQRKEYREDRYGERKDRGRQQKENGKNTRNNKENRREAEEKKRQALESERLEAERIRQIEERKRVEEETKRREEETRRQAEKPDPVGKRMDRAAVMAAAGLTAEQVGKRSMEMLRQVVMPDRRLAFNVGKNSLEFFPSKNHKQCEIMINGVVQKDRKLFDAIVAQNPKLFQSQVNTAVNSIKRAEQISKGVSDHTKTNDPIVRI